VILLDTHIWIWWVHKHENLPKGLLRTLSERNDLRLGVSIISCWEVAKLTEHGRLRLPFPVDEWLRLALAHPGVSLLPLSPEIVVDSTRLPGAFHRDPADQLLVATARIIEIPIVTVDERIRAYPHVECLQWGTD